MVRLPGFTRRRASVTDPARGHDLPEAVRQALPKRFEAVGEALASGTDTVAPCAVVGRDVARDGAALGEALSGLRATYELVVGTSPDLAAFEAVALAWSEATLEYLHQISCEDPLTGMASLAHVRSRLAELYRDAEQAGGSVHDGHALVVVDLPSTAAPASLEQELTQTLRMVSLTEAVRRVFSGGETIGRLGRDRAVVLVQRRPGLGASVSRLRQLVGELVPVAGEPRVWIEGLASTFASGARLLDDLAR